MVFPDQVFLVTTFLFDGFELKRFGGYGRHGNAIQHCSETGVEESAHIKEVL